MCLPNPKDLRLRLNESGEGIAYKLFQGSKQLLPLVQYLAHGKRMSYKTGCWIKSTSGPGFFMYKYKKEITDSEWSYTQLKRIKFRKVTYEGIGFGASIIVAKEIFIPKEA